MSECVCVYGSMHVSECVYVCMGVCMGVSECTFTYVFVHVQ
jgi:hypothetical protein